MIIQILFCFSQIILIRFLKNALSPDTKRWDFTVSRTGKFSVYGVDHLHVQAVNIYFLMGVRKDT